MSSMNCPFCYHLYDDSKYLLKILRCGHVCCFNCLQNLFQREKVPEQEISYITRPGNEANHQHVSSSSENADITPCLLCQSSSKSDLNSFPTNVSKLNEMSSSSNQLPESAIPHECSQCKKTKREVVSHCETCNQFLCHSHSITHQDDFEDHQTVPLSSDSRISMCSKHKKDELEFYCRGCLESICSSCCILDHRNHDCISLEDAFQEMKSNVGRLLLPLDGSCTDMSMCVSRLSELGNDLTKKEKEIEHQIHESFRNIQLALDTRRAELISSLPSKRLQVEAHKHSIQSLRTQVTEKTQSCKDQMECNNMIRVLSSRESVSQLLSSANDEAKSIDWRVEKFSNSLELQCLEDAVILSIHQLGQLSESGNPIKINAAGMKSSVDSPRRNGFAKTTAELRNTAGRKREVDSSEEVLYNPFNDSDDSDKKEASRFTFSAAAKQKTINNKSKLQNEEIDRRKVVALLKTMRTSAPSWNSPDDDDNPLYWEEDLNLSQWPEESVLIDDFGHVTVFWLVRLGMKGRIPDFLGDFSFLTRIDFSENQITSIPSSIGLLKRVKQLLLFNNHLESLPDSIGEMTALVKLSVNNNKLASLPASIERLQALTSLLVSSNRLSALPDLSKLRNLTELRVCVNPIASNKSELTRRYGREGLKISA